MVCLPVRHQQQESQGSWSALMFWFAGFVNRYLFRLSLYLLHELVQFTEIISPSDNPADCMPVCIYILCCGRNACLSDYKSSTGGKCQHNKDLTASWQFSPSLKVFRIVRIFLAMLSWGYSISFTVISEKEGKKRLPKPQSPVHYLKRSEIIWKLRCWNTASQLQLASQVTVAPVIYCSPFTWTTYHECALLMVAHGIKIISIEKWTWNRPHEIYWPGERKLCSLLLKIQIILLMMQICLS